MLFQSVESCGSLYRARKLVLGLRQWFATVSSVATPAPNSLLSACVNFLRQSRRHYPGVSR